MGDNEALVEGLKVRTGGELSPTLSIGDLRLKIEPACSPVFPQSTILLQGSR